MASVTNKLRDLAKRIDRKEFTEKFLELSYNVARSDSDSAIELSYAVQSHLAPAIHGIVSEDDLRNALTNCLLRWIFIQDDARVRVWKRNETSSSVSAIATFQEIPA